MSLAFEIIPVTAFQQNCSLIWCTETMEGALVDPGGDTERLKAAVEGKGIKIASILLTHGHLDHAGGANPLAKVLEVPIIGPHQDDKYWLDAIEQHSQNYGLSGMFNCSPDQWLNEGETVSVGNEQLEVLHCPGHTPGHLVFFHRESQLAFVGDVLFEGSIGRTDFPGGDYQTLINSITGKLWPLGNDVRFIPGHGNMSRFGKERATNPFVSDQAIANS